MLLQPAASEYIVWSHGPKYGVGTATWKLRNIQEAADNTHLDSTASKALPIEVHYSTLGVLF